MIYETEQRDANECLAAIVNATGGCDDFSSLRPQDVLAIPGVANFLAPMIVERLGGLVDMDISLDDAETDLELRLDQVRMSSDHLADLITSRTRVVAPVAGLLDTVLGNDKSLLEAFQQFAFDIASVGIAAINLERALAPQVLQ
ncbi:hypothetical protein [Labrys sp. ZIDIC5]|uniref:hypothetical protein n=1 Tax=Labrys sedimenti TaxID=3106036 RepID=UPI002ACAFBF9|nr:hypothetical protein [Labrys sp. ZIDIC5]MDZ5448258.1 hypothetical protein [Labrys sp. ZIDIC5]